jgi:hypothetical protein
MRKRSLLNAGTLALAIGAAGALQADPPPAGHIAVTPDSIKWAAGPASLPPGAQGAVLEGDPAKPGPFTIRLRVPPNYTIAPHRHPAAERVTVLGGTVCVGFGERVVRENPTCFTPGSFYVNPAEAAHFVWTAEKKGATVQISGVGPWQLSYVDASTDPRK